MKILRRIDEGMARGEAAIATAVLLILVVVAALQSFFRNLADKGVDWANGALESMSWGDSFMEKATLWLAMFGASLATHYDKHIAIDVLARVAQPKLRAVMRGTVQVFAGVTSFYFARVVLGALKAKAVRIPPEWGVFDDDFNTVHICEGTAEAIENAGFVRPDWFCTLRDSLESLGLTAQVDGETVAAINTPERAMDLLVPAMFCVIGVRFFLKGIGSFSRVPSGGIPDSELEGGEPGVPDDELSPEAQAEDEAAAKAAADADADAEEAEKADAGATASDGTAGDAAEDDAAEDDASEESDSDDTDSDGSGDDGSGSDDDDDAKTKKGDA
ncbi:MAG TPA: TRAP transporter small permease subunit [Polyangiaceae bacterium LLY-WYZ-15_(1-7)]|nr:TRAP transporter small permease subunit [Polyangiaceae bacterium LLY-WYZ-15_(1-7)]HJL02825.1 TRAP transporter small permease subunit [Polyangiaceae bacterium LLY-WYZ-15_(1-7)]HJL13208.1 TRAP transporter small permease subunit [Polyangiaceae bacterium LLY-WYZ-15_(1-7)]HJL34768.1 TRAP transporter small permease subunit [Polyangiaceae bacterium LLY-WYZ-15_(1-7)]HJL49851.1 TRAP transporter small permease subunit [Polyangiaceae bacterium LLY-WYZ-15_(1-7)]